MPLSTHLSLHHMVCRWKKKSDLDFLKCRFWNQAFCWIWIKMQELERHVCLWPETLKIHSLIRICAKSKYCIYMCFFLDNVQKKSQALVKDRAFLHVSLMVGLIEFGSRKLLLWAYPVFRIRDPGLFWAGIRNRLFRMPDPKPIFLIA